MKLILARLLWRTTHRNILGWPDERVHRLSGRIQHIHYNVSAKWCDGPLTSASGPYRASPRNTQGVR